MRVHLLLYRADVEGDWLREPVDLRVYPTEAAARAAWARAYRGPDDLGNQAVPEVVEIDVDLDDLPGLVYVPGHGYLRVADVMQDEEVV